MRAQLEPRRFTLSVALVASVLALQPRSAAAQEEMQKPELILLPVEGQAASPRLDAELQQAITAVGKNVQLSSLQIEDLMLGVGCDSVSVACLQKIGTTVAAEGLLLSTLRPSESGQELVLRWFDVKTGGDLGQATVLLPADETARQPALAEAVRQLFGLQPTPTSSPVKQQEPTGSLSISASVPFVEVILDGQPRGALPLELRELPVGRYTVVGRREGYQTWRGTVEVMTGQTAQLDLEMVPSPTARPPKGYMDSIRTSTWAIAGVGFASLVGGAAFAAVMQTDQNTFDETRGITPAEIAELKDLKESGERNALAANILFGLGGAALLTAAVLSYFDYRGQRQPEEPSSTALSIGPGSIELRVSY